MTNKIYSVEEINEIIDRSIKELSNEYLTINLRGEIADFTCKNYYAYLTIISSNYKNYSKNTPSIKAIMSKHVLETIDFEPKKGDKIIIKSRISFYKQNCNIRLLIYKIRLDGEGERLIALEQLKKKLEKEGIFKNKREINLYPNAVGIITAQNSEALEDFISKIKKRYPVIIYIFYAIVQGESAPKSLINALSKAYKYDLDTIIVGRGGGATSDLDAFNNEELARFAFKSPYPIISAIGHFGNKTIFDEVADKCAGTPTDAIDIVAVDKEELFKKLKDYSSHINQIIKLTFNNKKNEINSLKKRQLYHNPLSILQKDISLIEQYKITLNNVIKNTVNNKENYLKNLKEKIKILNSEEILKRGFAYLKDKNKKIIKNVDNININDEIETVLYNGSVYSIIIKKQKNE